MMRNKRLIIGINAAIFAFVSWSGQALATPVLYNGETDFLNDIASLGYETWSEDFEGPCWDHVRSPDPFNRHSAPSVTNLGVTWTGRPDNLITTNHNWARDNNGWGVYEDQISGFSSSELFGTADRTLYAVGGWINTNPDGGDMTIEVNGQIVDGIKIGSGHQFVGVIDADGFTEFRILDIEQQTVWGADDFTYAAVRAPRVELDLDPVCPNGGETRLAWADATPGGRVAILYAPNLGPFTIPNRKPCGGTQIDLSPVGLKVGYIGKSNAQGRRDLMVNIPPGFCGNYIQAVDLDSCEFSAPVVIE